VSSLFAADIPVNRVNDSGVGSLRQGLSDAAAGDRLAFQPILDGTTLVNGPSLNINFAETLLDSNSITVTDYHAFSLSAATTVDWKGSLTLNGQLSNGSTVGSLIKTGFGTLILSGNSIFTGGTTINGGTIELLSANALGTGALTANGTQSTAVLEFGKSLNVTNTITLTTALTVNSLAGTSNTLSGIISNSANATTGLVTAGSGTLNLNAANTFTGGVTVGNDSTIILGNSAGFGTGTVKNNGVLTLELSNGLAVSNKFTLNNDFIANIDSGSATLSGNIIDLGVSQLTKTGLGTLILTGTNAYNGGTVLSEGVLRVNSGSISGNITDNASLVFNQIGTGTYAGNISGTGELTKIGAGTLIFGGNSSLTSTTQLVEGELQVTGALAGGVNVTSNAAALTGTGTVGSVVNSGIVQPGTASIGTLTVNGNFTQQSAGTTEIKINSAGNTPGTNNDNLVVTGQAKLDGKLNVLAIGGGVFTAGTQYTMLNATGGVTGQYSQASTNLSMFGIDVTYDANDVKFELVQTTSLKAAAITANQSAVGGALDNIALTSTGDLFAMINTLGIQSPDAQRQAMNQLSGEVYGNLQTLGLQIGDQFQQRLTHVLVANGPFLTGQPTFSSSNSEVRGQSPTDAGRGWVQGFGVNGNIRSDGNGAGVNYNQGGALFGADAGDDETGRFGIAGGVSGVSFHDGFDASGQLTAYQVGVYGIRQDDLLYILGTMNAGYNSYGVNRNVTISTATQQLHSSFAGKQFGSSIESGLKLSAGIVQIQPLVGLQYLLLGQDSFVESGGPAALSVGHSTANSLRANVGARMSVNQFVTQNGTVWTPYSQARFVTDLIDNDRLVDGAFIGAPVGGAFTTHGTRIGQSYGVLGGGAEVRLTNNWSILGMGDYLIGERISAVSGSLTAVTSGSQSRRSFPDRTARSTTAQKSWHFRRLGMDASVNEIDCICPNRSGSPTDRLIAV